MKIVILGNGAWGSSLFSVIAQKNKDVLYWDEKNKIEEADVYVVCLPVQIMRSALKRAKFSKDKKYLIVNCSKGIEKKTNKLPHEIINEVVLGKFDYYTLIGPSFANEVKAKKPTMVNIGYAGSCNRKLLKELFVNEYFRIKITKGVKELELSSALKNVYAIACGICDGLGYECNTRALIISTAIAEMYKIINLKKTGIIGAIGDLILTCSSNESRNFRFGQLIAKYKIKDALVKVGATVEGLGTVDSVKIFNKPLLNFVATIVRNDNPKKVKDRFDEFLNKI
jgi:glycerol-3-phosphate dehydrogenase (NAD(P)+)